VDAKTRRAYAAPLAKIQRGTRFLRKKANGYSFPVSVTDTFRRDSHLQIPVFTGH
jgi:hypothetical protein